MEARRGDTVRCSEQVSPYSKARLSSESREEDGQESRPTSGNIGPLLGDTNLLGRHSKSTSNDISAIEDASRARFPSYMLEPSTRTSNETHLERAARTTCHHLTALVSLSPIAAKGRIVANTSRRDRPMDIVTSLWPKSNWRANPERRWESQCPTTQRPQACHWDKKKASRAYDIRTSRYAFLAYHVHCHHLASIALGNRDPWQHPIALHDDKMKSLQVVTMVSNHCVSVIYTPSSPPSDDSRSDNRDTSFDSCPYYAYPNSPSR